MLIFHYYVYLALLRFIGLFEQMQNLEGQFQKENYSSQISEIAHNSKAFTSFQLKLIVFFFLTSFFTNFQINSSHLFYMNPAFSCLDVQGKQTEEYACKVMDSCQIINKQSVTAQLRLYCDSSSRIFIQSSIGIGNWIGIVFSVILSDRMGRKFCFLLAFAFLNISWIFQYIGISQKIIILLSISEVIIGFSNNTIYINFLILSSRFLRKDLSELATLGWFIASNSSIIGISILNRNYQNWHVLFYTYTIAMIALSISSFIILYEDPVYYFDTGKYEECKRVLQKIQKQNEIQQSEIIESIKKMNQFIQSKQLFVSTREQGQKINICRVLNKSDLLNYVLILGLAALCILMSGVCAQYSIQGLKLSYNDNLLIIGASNIFGFLTAILVIKMEERRKRGFLFSTFLCSIAGFMFGFKFCSQNSTIQSIFLSLFKITSCWVNYFFVRLKVDLAPEKYQGSLIGILQFIGNMGRVIGPPFVNLSTQHALKPIFSISLLNITVGTIPIFFLREKKIRIGDNADNKQ